MKRRKAENKHNNCKVDNKRDCIVERGRESIPVAIILPLPMSLNHCYITTRQGKRIMTEEHRIFKEAMRLQLKSMIPKCEPKLGLLQLRFFWPDRKRRDYDNYSKITLDILKGILVDDDSAMHIGELVLLTAGIDKQAPRVEITWV